MGLKKWIVSLFGGLGREERARIPGGELGGGRGTRPSGV